MHVVLTLTTIQQRAPAPPARMNKWGPAVSGWWASTSCPCDCDSNTAQPAFRTSLADTLVWGAQASWAPRRQDSCVSGRPFSWAIGAFPTKLGTASAPAHFVRPRPPSGKNQLSSRASYKSSSVVQLSRVPSRALAVKSLGHQLLSFDE